MKSLSLALVLFSLSLPIIVAQTPEATVSSAPLQIHFSGANLASGSAVTAGSDTELVDIAPEGQVRVCAGSTVSFTYPEARREVMLSLSSGSLEADLKLQSSSNSILTPDFRILLAGPGEFHFATAVDARGNTCVRTLPGNTAALVVSEMLGTGVYQIKPSEQVEFRGGRLDAANANLPPDCGCPAPLPLITHAQPESAPLPPSKPDDVHVQVDASFAFNGNASPPVADAPVREVRVLSVRSWQRSDYLPAEQAVPPVVTPPRPTGLAKVGSKIKHFFAALFL